MTPVTDATYVADYGAVEYRLDLSLAGGVNGIAPAELATNPPDSDFWFTPGSTVTLSAQAKTGFRFLGWTGDLLGHSNPATFSIVTPVSAGADFELVYSIATQPIELPAATPVDLHLMVEHGTAPVVWSLVSGSLPEGVAFDASGRFTGASLQNGSFTITVSASDATGLPAQADIVLDFVRPRLSIDELTSQFLLVGPRLSDAQQKYLNREGNNTGACDLGDFRAWTLSDPTLPLSVSTDGVVLRTILVGDMPPRSEVPR